MPAKRKPGRGRLDLKYPAPFTDMIAETAQAKLLTLSQYVRDALIERLEKDGRMRTAIHAALLPEPDEPAPKTRKKKRKE